MAERNALGNWADEGENDDDQASTSDGNLPAGRTSYVLGSGGRKRANDGNTGDNINHIAARLRIKKLKL